MRAFLVSLVEDPFFAFALLAVMACIIIGGCLLFGCQAIEDSAGHAMRYAIEGGIDRAFDRFQAIAAPPSLPTAQTPPGGEGGTWIELLAAVVSFTVINVGHRYWYHKKNKQ